MMSAMRLLALAGRHGPALLCGGVLIGIACPALATGLRPEMDAAVFCFTLGAFLRVDAAALGQEFSGHRVGRLLLALGWASVGVPLFVAGVVTVMQPPAELGAAMILCTLAPPIASAAAVAAMLGLSPPLALVTSTVATIAAPLVMPPLAETLTGTTLMLDPLAIASRLLAIVGGAALTSWALRRVWPTLIRGQTTAMTGIGVVSLLVFAAAAMAGMQERLLADPLNVLGCLGLAFAVNAGLQVIAAALFARAGRGASLTVGLVSGNRNIGLMWAAIGQDLPPLVETYFAMSILPIYMLPILSQRVVATLLAERPPRERAMVAGRPDVARPS